MVEMNPLKYGFGVLLRMAFQFMYGKQFKSHSISIGAVVCEVGCGDIFNFHIYLKDAYVLGITYAFILGIMSS
jgi:hypothetical protein